MIKSKNLHLIDIIPTNLIREKSSNDIIKAIGNQEDKLFLKVDKSIIDDLENQSEEVIWHLLWEKHLIKKEEGIELAVDKKARIDLILAAIELHRHKGTPYALDLIFDSLGLDGHITEWFEDDSAPYTFKADINVFDMGINEETYDMFERLIRHYKNVRSGLSRISVNAINKGFAHVGASFLGGEVIEIRPTLMTQSDVIVPNFTQSAIQAIEIVNIYPEGVIL